jgi:hypothetical protein
MVLTKYMENFNIQTVEKRMNMVECNVDILTSKLKHSGDGLLVNLYQKTKGLLDWMVGYFSWLRQWVLDLFFGFGARLASCMAYIWHYVVMEIEIK